MKLIFFGLFLLGFSNASPAIQEELLGGDLIGDIIATIIKEVLNSICSQITDPINVADENIELNLAELASGHLELKDFVESGLKGLQASNITVSTKNPAKLYIILGVPSVDVNTNYDADILLASLIPIYGNGLANINLKNIQLSLTSGYKLTLLPKQSLTINGLSFDLSIDSATFDIHGVINNEAFSVIVGQILDDTIAPFINNHSARLSQLLSPVLEQVINQVLSGGKKSVLNTNLSEELNQKELQELMVLYMRYMKTHPKFAELL